MKGIQLRQELMLDLLQMKEISTYRQQKNGTRIFQLPIKKYGQYIEVGSFKSGYVRRMNGGYTPYQLNKCEPNVEYYKDYEHFQDQNGNWRQEPTGKYNKYVGKKRILIDNEYDRINHLITYCLKNYYINQANMIEDGKFIPKWKHDRLQEKYDGMCSDAYNNGYNDGKEEPEVKVIVNGHKYNVI